MSDECKVHALCAHVINSLDVSGLVVKSVATMKVVGLAWMTVPHSALLSEGKRFIFSVLTLSNFCSVWGTFVLLLQFFQSEIEECVKFNMPVPLLPPLISLSYSVFFFFLSHRPFRILSRSQPILATGFFTPPPYSVSNTGSQSVQVQHTLLLQQKSSAGSKLITEAAKHIPAVVNKCKYIFISNRFPCIVAHGILQIL